MPADVYKELVAKARDGFVRDTAAHEATVLHDDEPYRHIRFQKPGSSLYWFDLITWPGCLVINGDMGTYTFSRKTDMFEFFGPSGRRRGFEDAEWGINPQYWAEKLRGPGQHTAQSYSEETFKAQVRQWFDGVAEEMSEEASADLLSALEYNVLSDDVTYDETSARAALRDFTYGVTALHDASYDWDLHDFDYAYLWCCWAIVWGVEQYQKVGSHA